MKSKSGSDGGGGADDWKIISAAAADTKPPNTNVLRGNRMVWCLKR